jgi:hypothetical protein
MLARARGSEGRPIVLTMMETSAGDAVECFSSPAMTLYYSDVFVLPLPSHHRFPMGKYAREALTRGWSANLAGGTHHAFRDRGEGMGERA